MQRSPTNLWSAVAPLLKLRLVPARLVPFRRRLPHNCQALQQPFSSSSTLNVDIPKASLNYVAETGKRAAILISGKLNEVPNFVSTDQFVKDARLVQPSPTIADFGFQLITHKTNLSKRDFYVHESQKIHPVYYGEIADAVKKVFPDAAHIKVFHHAVRKSAPMPEGPSVDGKSRGFEKGRPAEMVHCDYTANSAFEALKLVSTAEYRRGRYVIVSAWRSISEYPVQNDHFAVCDGRSVATPDDFVVVDLTVENSKSELYSLSPVRKETHQWYYYPQMRKNEVLVLLQYDSNWKTLPRYTFHTSFKDPNASKDVPPRESIECRCMVFFPDFEPNTIPVTEIETVGIVDEAVYKITKSVEYGSFWPEDAKIWMGVSLYADNGVESVVKAIVVESAKLGHHGLDKATEDQIDEVIFKLLSSDDFERLAKSTFPQMKLVDAATRSIMNLLGKPEQFSKENVDWLKAILHASPVFEEVTRIILDEMTEKQMPFLIACSREQRDEVVQRLLANGDFEKEVKNLFKE